MDAFCAGKINFLKLGGKGHTFDVSGKGGKMLRANRTDSIQFEFTSQYLLPRFPL
jgi:hypothetical protein